ncbi:hypothetical protein FACS1894190_08300 [Spirochaetia bacterium]|nr:hypothetical protein FACS1894190_08300 [Spirochaetia bacterium]
MIYSLKGGQKNICGICPIPFVYAKIHNWGNGFVVYTCCADAVKSEIGVVDENHSIEEVWNGDKAKSFRQKLLKKDYSDCDLTFCNIGLMLARLDYFNGKEVNYAENCGYPLMVDLAHDDECNLMCTTCRDKTIINTPEQLEYLNERIDTVILPLLKKAKIVLLSSGGEVFFSRHYKELIKRINETYPDIKYILNTNGQLFTQKNYDLLWSGNDKIYSVIVSIHSIKKEVYEEIMRGGKWETLLENLNFILALKNSKRIEKIYFNFVIQTKNYKEMPEMVRFSRKYGAIARFRPYVSWGTSLSYDDAAVFNKDHPEFPYFLKIIQDPIFSSKDTYLDPIAESLQKKNKPNLTIRRLIKYLLPYGVVRLIQKK